MKQQFKTAVLILALGFSLGAAAQTGKEKTAPWAPQQGYWVVESSNSLQHLVRFYNNENVLLYSEKLEGVKLKPAKRKVQMQLKAALESAIFAWEQTRQPCSDRAFVMKELK